MALQIPMPVASSPATKLPIGQRYLYVTDREVRIVRYSHYRIAYLIRRDTGDIDILVVFHGALPIERYLL